MPRTESNPVELGFQAPDFQLPDASGRLHGPGDHAGAPALLVAFISNRCPFVVGIREAFADFARRNAPRGLRVIAINANDAEAHSEETLERLGLEATAFGYDFPYVKDETQEVARAYGAACTPDLFLFDAAQHLVYHGQFDGFRPNNGVTPTGESLQAAVDALLAGEPPIDRQVPSIGCNIKWRPETQAAVAAE
ncbi:Alkyl hydroperoxide reductase and/or thiol-specific antioxidant family (AhpC/TSA) protein [Rubellimicrobium mesophilum DSM 19309]|uniref:Alkyl hydroperoxide reductase and/or thiol-specific antioxidant family (AhpC/TSA) protein n=1 Tax=Rubellimicrobium mesophilum DSM 19309 TaxID=442562 RepID=A0A017HIT9_9RHOB|nr:thioredoxin family protein [Rubellimicrobium mesophilum]EYD74250.1 Alkyl hydroperoxide reductase and/or thiol-specific antioxidant family (AhpC/TSA) protein [Rubellimicrobium mesophilum DSM 19309]